MAYTQYSDIHISENIQSYIEQNWQDKSRIIPSTAVQVSPTGLPSKGSSLETIWGQTFQGRTGQAKEFSGDISVADSSQVSQITPIVSRYEGYFMSEDEADIRGDVASIVQGAASVSTKLTEAAAEYIDDTAVFTLEGASAALSDNYAGAADTLITYNAILNAQSELEDNAVALDGGAIFMRSPVYYKLLGDGVAITSSNPLPDQLREGYIVEGRLPQLLGGLNVVVTDKLSDITANTQFYVYLVGPGLITYTSNGVSVRQEESALKYGDIFTMRARFAMSVAGMSYKGTLSEKISDTDIATSTNWESKALYSKNIPLVRLSGDIA